MTKSTKTTGVNGTSLLQYAFEHLWADDPVIPIYRKVPIVKWQRWQAQLPTETELADMPWQHADGLALVLGDMTASHGSHLWVLDIEVEHRSDAERWLDSRMPAWRRGRVVETGSGGLHLYCHSAQPVQSTKFRWGDIKGHGSLTYLPPSEHPSGGSYRWLSNGTPTHLEPDQLPGTRSVSRPFGSESDTDVPTKARMRSDGGDLGQVLADMVNDERNLPLLLPLLGIDSKATVGGRAFLCPFCNERRPSASLWRGSNGRIVVRCWHAHAGRCPAEDYNLLATIYAAQQTGSFERLIDGGKLAAWTLRLLRDAGIVHATKPRLVLPSGMSNAERRLARGIAEVQSLAQQVLGQDVPVAFTRAFAIVWTGLTQYQITKGWKALSRMKIVQAFSSSGKLLLWKIRSVWRRSSASTGQTAPSTAQRGSLEPDHNALGRHRPEPLSRFGTDAFGDSPARTWWPPWG